MSYFAGLGKADMTCFIPGIGMMGYGQPHNTVKDIKTPLIARVLILKDETQTIIYAHLEQAFITIALKDELLKEIQTEYPNLNINHSNLLITAQHTHSAPGGYSHYPFYNFTIPNFRPKVIETVCRGVLKALDEAINSLEAVTLHYGEHDIDSNVPVAFNRSMKAYLNNKDIPSLSYADGHLAVNRKMTGLFIQNSEKKLIGFLNWFGVHCTSISSFNNSIHHDNKGVAANLFEKHHPGCIALFIQEAAGDVSPNYVWDKKLKRMRGPSIDQYENAHSNGELQYKEALKVSPAHEIKGEINTHHHFYDMTKVASSPAHGLAFFKGTLEGPGVHPAIGNILKKINHFIKDENFSKEHGAKDIILDHRTGKFIGLPLKLWKRLPPLPDKTVEYFRIAAKKNSLTTLPWVPTILPFQIITIGPFAIIGCAGEITTEAAKRLKAELARYLPNHHLMITSYANAYMGYVTTPEEYAIQCYEGGHTVYGPQTLHAYTQGFTNLLSDGPSELKSFKFDEEELKRRTTL